jgi:hypothetical protein
MTLTVLFIASVTLDGLGWRDTFAARAARSVKWFALGFAAVLVVAFLTGQVPNS